MAKRNRGDGISLDSFLDILTCLQGVLMLIIITTGIDAAQTKVLVKTPLNLSGNFRPIYVECRNQQLFNVKPQAIRDAVMIKQREIAESAAGGGAASLLKSISETDVIVDDYVVDLRYLMVNQLAVRPREDAVGYSIGDPAAETPNTWFGGIIDRMDKENEKIHFFVRDDSFEAFKRARIKAWTDQVKVSYELIAKDAPIRLEIQ